MNEIYNRRSIRKYTSQKIDDDKLKQILKAGMNAPTARNLKPFEFIIIKNREILEDLSNLKKNSYFVKDSYATIVILGNELTEFWQQDLAAVTQNILLQATTFGIASCWIGMAPNQSYEQSARQILNIPDNIRVFSMVTLGYPLETKEPNDNYYENLVHFDKY